MVDGASYRLENERYYAQYQAGTLDILEFLAFALRPLAMHDLETLCAWHRRFLEEKIRPMITDSARALVESHRARGHTLVIITATNSFVTAPIAAEFGIQHLIATEAEMRDDHYTGNVRGVPCYREGKVTRLKAWMTEHGETLADSWFYSDSHERPAAPAHRRPCGGGEPRTTSLRAEASTARLAQPAVGLTRHAPRLVHGVAAARRHR